MTLSERMGKHSMTGATPTHTVTYRNGMAPLVIPCTGSICPICHGSPFTRAALAGRLPAKIVR